MSVRDLQDRLHEASGVEVSAQTISTVTDKVWGVVEGWQHRPLAAIYPIVYLDAMPVKLRRDGHVQNTAISIVLGVDLDGQRDVLGHWIGAGGAGANFWLSVVTDLQSRGVQDIFIACVDGLQGFSEAIDAVFPQAQVQRCVIHQVRHRLTYVAWKDRQAVVADRKAIYQAPTRELAETKLLELGERWGERSPIAVRSWERTWDELATMFDYPTEIRRLIYTPNSLEGYNRQVRKVTKTKGAFPTDQAVRKLRFLVTRDITQKWLSPKSWTQIRNQLAIRFADRFPAP
jgi:transposase-like protein